MSRKKKLQPCESVQREIVFRELARLYKTKYDYWYELWLYG